MIHLVNSLRRNIIELSPYLQQKSIFIADFTKPTSIYTYLSILKSASFFMGKVPEAFFLRSETR